jgi:lysozyme family protein
MMLIGPAAPNVQFLGLSGGSPAVSGLQQSLKALAQVTGRVAIDPGAVDGIVGPRTMTAVVAGFSFIAEKLPNEAKYAIQAALVVGSTTAQAKELVTRYASQLDMATKAAILKYSGGGSQPTLPTTPTPASPPVPPPSPMPSAAVSFLKTPFGMAAAGVSVLGIGLLVYSLVSK